MITANKRWVLILILTVVTAACRERSGSEGAALQPPADEAASSMTETSEPARTDIDSWIGRWNGPEGTYLSIEKATDGYALEIADLDGPKKYAAREAGDHLEFERSGKTETIRRTDGKQTGMKWLQDKSECLTIRAGEGFCRD